MNRIILISLFSLMFSQAELTTRLYELDIFTMDNHDTVLNINTITGYDLDNPVVSIQSIDVNEFGNNDFIQVSHRTYYPISANEVSTTYRRFFMMNVNGQIWDAKTIHPEPNGLIFLESDMLLSGIWKIAITAEFPDEDAETINSLQSQIDDLTAQVNNLVDELTGCVDCQGDLINDGIVNVIDIVELVNHILDTDTNGDCYTP